MWCLPEREVSGEIEESTEGPVNIVLIDLSGCCKTNGVGRETKTIVKNE